MEEQGQGTELELRWRSSFAQVEDLMDAHQRWEDFKPDDAKFSPEVLKPLGKCLSAEADYQ
jgi:hypothetical protein